MTPCFLGLALFGTNVHQLGADEYAVRQAAEERLQRHAWLAAPLLRWPFQDPERRRRALRIVQRHQGRVNPPEGVWPCIGALSPESAARHSDTTCMLMPLHSPSRDLSRRDYAARQAGGAGNRRRTSTEAVGVRRAGAGSGRKVQDSVAPSTRSATPLMWAASAEARKAIVLATVSGPRN